MRSLRSFILFALAAGALQGCGGGPPTRAPGSDAATPSYQIVASEDISIGAIRRVQVRVSLPWHYSQSAVEQVAKAVVVDVTRPQPVNAVSILFYGPSTSTAGPYDVAVVEWAPNGRWADAGFVQAGNYSTFGYTISYKAPVPAPMLSASPAPRGSAQTGLLGVPLPEAARLIAQTAGDPAAGRDPSERYALSASAAEIAAFFTEVMPAAGWAKDGTSTKTALIWLSLVK